MLKKISTSALSDFQFFCFLSSPVGEPGSVGALPGLGEGDRAGGEGVTQDGAGPQTDSDHAAHDQNHRARDPVGQTD